MQRPGNRVSNPNIIYSNYFCSPFFFFFYNPGCPGQLMRTTTNSRTHWTPCKHSRQVRHRVGNRRARWGLNQGCRDRETLPRPLGHKPRCLFSHWLNIICLCVPMCYFPQLLILWFKVKIVYKNDKWFIIVWKNNINYLLELYYIYSSCLAASQIKFFLA